jgi:hypothetical protein
LALVAFESTSLTLRAVEEREGQYREKRGRKRRKKKDDELGGRDWRSFSALSASASLKVQR